MIDINDNGDITFDPWTTFQDLKNKLDSVYKNFYFIYLIDPTETYTSKMLDFKINKIINMGSDDTTGMHMYAVSLIPKIKVYKARMKKWRIKSIR